jgi:glycosyltransferase involved in cell wall biosynthesis
LSFAVSSSVGALFWSPAKQADVTLVYGSPATAALPAMILRAVHGVPYVIYVQDLWPDSITATGFFQGSIAQRWMVPLLDRLVGFSYRWAASVAVISPGMERELHQRGVPKAKTTLIHNWIGGDATPVDMVPEPESFDILYGGTVGRAQGLDVMVRAVHLAQDPEVHVHFVGDGVDVEQLKALADELIPGQATFTPRLALEDFQERATQASIMLVCLRDDPLFEITLPSKVQSSLGMGLPLIASGGRDMRELVLAAGAGWTAPAGDVAALAQAIRDAKAAGADNRTLRGRSGRDYFDAHLTESVNGSKLHQVLQAAAGFSGYTSTEVR